MNILFRNCKFVPELTQGSLSQGDVLVEDGKITRVATSISDAVDVKEIDLGGQYLLPGFFDLHVHLIMSGNDVLYDKFKNDFQVAVEAYAYALDSLKAGFTTIRDIGSNLGMVNYVRDVINKGLLDGPRIISSGRIITPSENGNDYFQKMYSECDGCEEAIAGVRKELQNGADYIKIMASGAIMNPGGEPGSPIMSDDEMQIIVDTAAIKGKYVAAHAHSSKAVKQCITCGVRTIEHGSLVDQEGIDMLKDSTKTYIVPTVTPFASMINSDMKDATFILDKLNKFLEQFKKSIKSAYDQGLILGFATDQGIVDAFHGDNADEFIFRKEMFDMKNVDLLLQATKYSAIIAQVDDVVGTIDEGKCADFVILDGNPLEDISVCKEKVAKVVKDGKIVFEVA